MPREQWFALGHANAGCIRGAGRRANFLLQCRIPQIVFDSGDIHVGELPCPGELCIVRSLPWITEYTFRPCRGFAEQGSCLLLRHGLLLRILLSRPATHYRFSIYKAEHMVTDPSPQSVTNIICYNDHR